MNYEHLRHAHRSRTRGLITLVLAAGLAVSGACAGIERGRLPPTPTPVGAATRHVEIQLFSYKPGQITVPAGTTVIWVNLDRTEHTVTAGRPGSPSGAFDSGLLARDQSFAHTFEEPGEYPYFCSRHHAMTGTITVLPR